MKHTAATLYVGGTILPLTGRLARAAGLLVEDGKIRAVGDPGTLAALCPGARRVELHGAAVLPGFVDGHSHFSMALQLGPTADLGSCGSFEAIGDALAAFGRSHVAALTAAASRPSGTPWPPSAAVRAAT